VKSDAVPSPGQKYYADTMVMKNIFDKYKQVAGIWESELDTYSDEQFTKKPSEESWSIGQVYGHLVIGTMNYHIRQIEQCLLSDENQKEKKTFPGKLMFFIKSFPPVRIKVPPSPTYTPQQPESKKTIVAEMQLLQEKLRDLSVEIDTAVHFGKTKHPALGYLNAGEWYQLIIMHFRHHLRQKKRIDSFIKGQ
jgi:hypothetical protein